MKQVYKNKLNDYILEHKGSMDLHYIRGGFGFSYNYNLDYVCVYKIENLNVYNGCYYINDYPHEMEDKDAESYEIKEDFFSGPEYYSEFLGKNFMDNSIDTQFKKVREYFRRYEI